MHFKTSVQLLSCVLSELTLTAVLCGRSALLICGEAAGLFPSPSPARVIRGENGGPPAGDAGADSERLLRISSANHTLLLPLGGVPERKRGGQMSSKHAFGTMSMVKVVPAHVS